MLGLKTLGFVTTIKEVLRRLFGFSYSYNGVVVSCAPMFRALRRCLLKGYRVWGADGYVYVETPWGVLRAPTNVAPSFLGCVAEVEDFYGVLDVKGRVVVDVGVFMGETAVYFARRGALAVLGFEPVEEHFRIALDNVRLNGLEDRVILKNQGVWSHNRKLVVAYYYAGTGLHDSDNAQKVSLRLVSWEEVLRKAFGFGASVVVKVDCEGCEYTLLSVPCHVVSRADEWLIEIHGAHIPLVEHMSQCGYRAEIVSKLVDEPNVPPLSVWRFMRS